MTPKQERHLQAAQGFQELGLIPNALAELASVRGKARQTPEFVETLLLCRIAQRRWPEALLLSEQLKALAPHEPGAYLHAAYCLHELGNTEDAITLLRKGPRSLHKRPVFFYNLGCYYSSLNDLVRAHRCLLRSFELDPSLKITAKRDPDLDTIRSILTL
jgi:tetratricopeptide (TPR) repeat protein